MTCWGGQGEIFFVSSPHLFTPLRVSKWFQALQDGKISYLFFMIGDTSVVRAVAGGFEASAPLKASAHSSTACPIAWRAFRTVRRLVRSLGEHFAQFDGLSERLESVSHSSTACPIAWRAFRTVRRLVRSLGEHFAQFDGLSERSERLSYSSTACPNARRDFRTVRQLVRSFGETFAQIDGQSERSETPENSFLDISGIRGCIAPP